MATYKPQLRDVPGRHLPRLRVRRVLDGVLRVRYSSTAFAGFTAGDRAVVHIPRG
jgi:hypothetical protein